VFGEVVIIWAAVWLGTRRLRVELREALRPRRSARPGAHRPLTRRKDKVEADAAKAFVAKLAATDTDAFPPDPLDSTPAAPDEPAPIFEGIQHLEPEPLDFGDFDAEWQRIVTDVKPHELYAGSSA